MENKDNNTQNKLTENNSNTNSESINLKNSTSYDII